MLKVDVLGRVTIKREEREKILDAFEASGMTGQAFAIQHGIKVQTFASWIQKRRRARGDYDSEKTRRKLRMRKKTANTPRKAREEKSPVSSSLSLIEVALDDSAPTETPLEVVLPDGVTLRVQNAGQIALLKSIIRELSC